MYDFQWKRPNSIAQAVKDLAADDAQALGGGQTLIPTMKQRLASPAVLVSLTGISEMTGICKDDAERLCIGGATTHAAVAADGTYPGLSKLAAQIGDPAVRSRGTIGGSVANNDPSACYPAAVLASGATVVTSARVIDADQFFQGMFTTALEEGEIIAEIKLPVPRVSNYQKFVQPASRFALVGVFVAQFDHSVRVAVTGASENGVFRWAEAEAAFSANFSPDAIERLTLSTEGIMGDIHASSAYRGHLVKVMAQRAVTSAH